MTGICALRTVGVDVKRTLQIATVDVAVGEIPEIGIHIVDTLVTGACWP